jgi:hypothetical protein
VAPASGSASHQKRRTRHRRYGFLSSSMSSALLALLLLRLDVRLKHELDVTRQCLKDMVDTWRWRDLALDNWRQLVEAVVDITHQPWPQGSFPRGGNKRQSTPFNPSRSGSRELSPERLGLHSAPGCYIFRTAGGRSLSLLICEQGRYADAVCKSATLDRPGAEQHRPTASSACGNALVADWRNCCIAKCRGARCRLGVNSSPVDDDVYAAENPQRKQTESLQRRERRKCAKSGWRRAVFGEAGLPTENCTKAGCSSASLGTSSLAAHAPLYGFESSSRAARASRSTGSSNPSVNHA